MWWFAYEVMFLDTEKYVICTFALNLLFYFYFFCRSCTKTSHESFADSRLTDINLLFAGYAASYYNKYSITKVDTDLYFPM